MGKSITLNLSKMKPFFSTNSVTLSRKHKSSMAWLKAHSLHGSRGDNAHPVHAAITTNRAISHKSKRHLEKLALELEVLRQCPCGSKASIDEKVAAVNALCGRYSIHVLCDALSLPRGTYYNRKRREGQRTSYEINDEKLEASDSSNLP